MKTIAKELRDLSNDELQTKAADLKKELFNLRFQQAMGQIENPMRLRTLRRDIAKTKTILKEKYGRV
ncbi:MAG: 50S ribosomal protein L29 [Nitrospirota bacterium]|jgi:large subunit ribosomal protein L29